jgi:hypothetical protein
MSLNANNIVTLEHQCLDPESVLVSVIVRWEGHMTNQVI